MSNLTEFLIARIQDDEFAAYEHYSNDPDGADVAGAPCIHRDGSHPCPIRRRGLAECEAKRRIVGLHGVDQDGYCACCVYDSGGLDVWPCLTLRALAAIYADHPDYCGEWKH
jgi:hypothetical protein